MNLLFKRSIRRYYSSNDDKITLKRRTIKLTQKEIINLKRKLEKQILCTKNSDIPRILEEHKKSKHLDVNN